MNTMPRELAFNETELLISPKILVQKLIQSMDALGQSAPKASNPVWTTMVKTCLSQLADEINAERTAQAITTIFTKVRPGVREFMLDVVWWSKEQGAAREYMALAAEIEWAAERSWKTKPQLAEHTVGCVAEDFGKLLVVKSPIKLMIFCTDDTSGVIGEAGELQQQVLEEAYRQLCAYKHHVPGEQYIFLDAASNGNRRGWLSAVDAFGTVSPMKQI